MEYYLGSRFAGCRQSRFPRTERQLPSRESVADRPLLDGHRNELVALNLPLGQANRLSVANVRHVDEHSPGIRKPEWDTNRVNSPGATFWHLEPTKNFRGRCFELA